MKIKHNQDRPNQIQKYNFMQNVFFEKKVYAVYKGVQMGSEAKPPKAGGDYENF